MILGVFINGFKSYAQTAYIHLCINENYKFTTIVGKNGTGKSAILEALNYYFKQGGFIYIPCIPHGKKILRAVVREFRF
jgi:AAA15 family ATPase/GTPase